MTVYSILIFEHFTAPKLIETMDYVLQLAPEFIASAQSTMNTIIDTHMKRFAKKSKKARKKIRSKLTFIGIHSRRTDHVEYESEKNLENIQPSYFLQAMDLYR